MVSRTAFQLTLDFSICDRSIEADDLARQPTLSRFENAIDVRSFNRLRDLLLDRFIGLSNASGPSLRSPRTPVDARGSPSLHTTRRLPAVGGKGGLCPLPAP
jgi:hypothetical protein